MALVDQPWVLAGRKVAAAPPTLDRAWAAVLAGIRPLDVPAFVVAQLAGASCAVALFRWLVPRS